MDAETNRPLTAFLGKAEALKDMGLNLTSVHFPLWSPEIVIPFATVTPGFSFLNDEVEM